MNFLRKIVSGKKNRFKENGYDLVTADNNEI